MNAEDFRNPFSSTFRQKLADMAFAIETLKQENAELKRLAADVEMFNGGGESAPSNSNLCFFEITSSPSGEWSPEDVACDGQAVRVVKYRGVAFDLEYGDSNNGNPCVNLVDQSDEIWGYDVIREESLPDEYPLTLESLTPDLLDAGVVVLAKRIGPDLAVFASVMPRLSVVC